MRRPLVCLLLLFCAGICFASYASPPLTFIYCLAVITYMACIFLAEQKPAYIALLFITVFLIGALRYSADNKRPNRQYVLDGPLLSLKRSAQAILYRHLPPVPASIVEAMVLGEKERISPKIYRSMMKTGTVHILVVSGFNVGIVAFLAHLVLKVLRIARKARIFIIVILLIVYCLLTGASNPVIRATIMGNVFLAAYFFKREADIYNSLSIAAGVILLASPRQLFNIGFQLSFASVLALVWLYPKIRPVFRVESLRPRPLKYLGESLLVSFSAWLGTAGIIAFYFKLISPVTVLANIIIVPLAALLTLSGFTLIFIGILLPQLAQSFASVIQLLAILLLQANILLSGLPFACLSLL